MRRPFILSAVVVVVAFQHTAAASTPDYPDAYLNSFLTPSLSPGTSSDGLPTALDTHCVGNGRSVACVVADVAAGAVTVTLRRADAQGKSNDIMTISQVVYTVAPNPFLAPAGGFSYNQTLDMRTASVFVTGGAGAAVMRVYVTTCEDHDSPPCDTALWSLGGSGGPFNVTVAATTVRPPTNTTYDISWNCFKATTAPDVFADPAPPGPLASALVQARNSHRNEAWDASAVETHLAQQNISQLEPLVADAWTNLSFGVAVLAAAGSAPLVRVGPALLASAAPAPAFSVRMVLHANQTEDAATWQAQLSARVAAGDPPLAQHEAWWAAFWNRSYVEVGIAQSLNASAPPLPSSVLLWLRADDLDGLADGAPVASWPDASGLGHDATQPNASAQPRFLRSGATGMPSVSFDGLGTFVGHATMPLPRNATVLAVFTDEGSTADYTGIFYAGGSCRGLSTSAVPGLGVVTLLDWCYSLDTKGTVDVTNRTVVGSVVYGPMTIRNNYNPRNDSAASFVDGCSSTFDEEIPGNNSTGYMVGSRNDELGRYFRGQISELLVYGAALAPLELAAAEAYLRAKWGVPSPPPGVCGTGADPLAFQVNQKFAAQRFQVAIQSRGHRFPVRFNGQLFLANLPPHSDKRLWGILDCWQNTRLAYVSLMATGDFDVHRVLLNYMSDRVPLSRGRTQTFFGHDGIHWTECKVPVGTPSSQHYDTNCDPSERPPGYPYWQVAVPSGNRFEYGGDGGTPEIGLAALDHFYYSQDPSVLDDHLPLATLAATFYDKHYPRNASRGGQLAIFPTGVLEYYSCQWDPEFPNGTLSSCCANDLPTVAGLSRLLAQLLTMVPSNWTTPAEVASWQALSAILPPLPTVPGPNGSTVLVPAEVMCPASDGNPVEAPEMYAVHPYRVFNVARSILDGVDLTSARAGFLADPRANRDNTDWNQGIMDAALLGLKDNAVELLLQRALNAPAPGYRWPAFAPAHNDYAPVSELYAGSNSALAWMLLQPGDDANGTLVLLPTWPCAWDVSFKLWGPLNTSVEVVYAGGAVTSCVVEPASRAGDVVWAGCVSESWAWEAGLPGRVAPQARTTPQL